MPAVLLFLGGLGRWLAGLLPAFFVMLGAQTKAARILGIAVNIAIALGVAAVMPLPDWLEELPSRIASMPSLFFWFVGMVELRFGVAAVLGAYVFRWVWRILTK